VIKGIHGGYVLFQCKGDALWLKGLKNLFLYRIAYFVRWKLLVNFKDFLELELMEIHFLKHRWKCYLFVALDFGKKYFVLI